VLFLLFNFKRKEKMKEKSKRKSNKHGWKKTVIGAKIKILNLFFKWK
jgi:hypothetical protein